MKKSVVVINDELGTMALGFSKAGYDVKAIYNDYSDKKNFDLCTENWGNIVRVGDFNQITQREFSAFTDIEYVAGNIEFNHLSDARRGRNYTEKNRSISNIQYLIGEIRPKVFLLQSNKLAKFNMCFSDFIHHIQDLGYVVLYRNIDTKSITGFPVNEESTFIVGALDSEWIKYEFPNNLNSFEYPIENFLEKRFISDEWYYKLSPYYLDHIEKIEENCLLCWNGNHYRKEKRVKWNSRMVPLIAEEFGIRKITHYEVANLKGIPEDYILTIKNKAELYQKLMHCSNVLLIQQLASTLYLSDGQKAYLSRRVSKELEFEKIIFSYIEKKGLNNTGNTKSFNFSEDYIYKGESGNYYFDFKIFLNNSAIENKVIDLSKKIYERENFEEEIHVLVVGNIVGADTKKYVESEYNIFIWDIENILWILDEYPMLKSDFISLLSFNISDIIPKRPAQNILKKDKDRTGNLDLREQLRQIIPGQDDANKYELLCEDVIKYLFSENVEFLGTQKKSNSGLYRFDCCGKIKHGNTSEFFDTIQRYFATKYIIFEFKNYDNEITQKEIYTTEKYLYEKALRKVAIIISRKGMDENARKASCGSLRELGKLIICLSDKDVIKLIDMKDNKEDPTDFLEVILDDMLMDLEK